PPHPRLVPYAPLFRSSARERLEAQHAPFPLSKVVNEPRPDRRKRRSGLGSLTATRLLGRSQAPCRTPRQHYDCVTTSAVLMPDPDRKSTRLNSSHVSS